MKKIYLATLFFLSSLFVAAQEESFMTGLLPDDGTYDQLPHKAELLTRDYVFIPTKHSLKQYCPEVKSQRQFGTCVGWATAYAGRTIAEAVKYGWTDSKKITEEAFSPLFVYTQLKEKNDTNCQKGIYLYKALSTMKYRGVAKLNTFNYLCANYISDNIFTLASRYTINDFFPLFESRCIGDEKIRKTRKSISEDHPVIIGMEIPQSFHKAGENWDGSDIDPSKHGHHAMCVIGYDDEKNGGSFQIMNSWGQDWGENGFVWVNYSDYAKYVSNAYEIYVKKAPKPEPKPEPNPKPNPVPIVKNLLSGNVELQLSTGEMMVPLLDTSSLIPHYKIQDSYISRTRYRIYISNNEPAYVYVIGGDMSGNMSKVFPPKDNISAALTYKQNHIAIPDETYFVEMDDTQGTDYLCILYSKENLDIKKIIEKMKSQNGSFYEKVNAAISNTCAPTKDIRYSQKRIEFSAETEKIVVPIIIEISHK